MTDSASIWTVLVPRSIVRQLAALRADAAEAATLVLTALSTGRWGTPKVIMTTSKGVGAYGAHAHGFDVIWLTTIVGRTSEVRVLALQQRADGEANRMYLDEAAQAVASVPCSFLAMPDSPDSTGVTHPPTRQGTISDGMALPLANLLWYPWGPDLARVVSARRGEVPFALAQAQDAFVAGRSSCILVGRSGTGKTACLLFRLWKRAKEDAPRQLYLTANPVLRGSVATYYARLCDGGRRPDNHPDFMSLPGLISCLVNDGRRESEPDTRCTVGGLIALEEQGRRHEVMTDLFETVLDILPKELQRSNSSTAQATLAGDKAKYTGKEVSIEVFREEYWPRLSQLVVSAKARDHDISSRVFTEMMTVIKGSNATLRKQAQWWLSENEYLTVPLAASATEPEERARIYALFLKYTKLKRERGDWDAMDVVHNVYVEMGKQCPVQFDEIYIDEVQDLTQTQLRLVMRALTPSGKIVFAGDSAQAINGGVGFRFEDLRQLQKTELPECILRHNYRSSHAVISMGKSVIQVLIDLFPGSVDHFDQFDESGVTEASGAQIATHGRLVFMAETDETGLARHLHASETAEAIDLGANQCVIVRNDAAKARAKAVFRRSLILTIYEAKGLEFDDVLVWDFFADSKAGGKWRAINKFLGKPAHRVAGRKDAVLCSDLKNLYTVVGRARQRVWFFDRDADARRPMLQLWKSLQLIEKRSFVSGGDQAAFANASSDAEWVERGVAYTKDGHYRLAADCFRNGGRPREAALLTARTLEVQLLRTLPDEGSDAQPTRSAIDQAIEISSSLDELGLSERAASLLERAGAFAEAARLYLRLDLTGPAAHCFSMAACWGEAAPLFEARGCLVEAAKCFQRHGNREKAAELFDAAAQNEEAAVLYEGLEQWRRAAQCWTKAGLPALSACALLKDGEVKLDEAAVNEIATQLVEGESWVQAYNLLSRNGRQAKADVVAGRYAEQLQRESAIFTRSSKSGGKPGPSSKDQTPATKLQSLVSATEGGAPGIIKRLMARGEHALAGCVAAVMGDTTMEGRCKRLAGDHYDAGSTPYPNPIQILSTVYPIHSHTPSNSC